MTSLIPLFESNHLLVLNKPAGLLTQPSGTDQDSLEQQAKDWIKQRDHKPGQVFLEAVHRLDKPVSGVTVFGKTSKALTRLNESIRSKQTVKIYWAWVEGHLSQKEGCLEHYLVHDEFQARVVKASYPQAKLARLSYREIERYSHYSLIEIQLDTGRYHQIRVQLAASGHPILGDMKYGSSVPLNPQVIALHHRRLEIPDPISKEMRCFEAPLPDYFKLAI
jgi:23S rRNA pseudouridine1911/1915/1917 synthase